ncbi:MAG: hypothetical protein AAB225_14720 [Acidobacteriota bacterium]
MGCRLDGEHRVEIWDADDFDPWETLQWQTVRVLRYRQHKRNGEVFEADWLTNFPKRKLNSLGLYRIGKSRWEIENQGFNGGAGDAVLSNSSAPSPPPLVPPDFRNCWRPDSDA